MHVERRGCPGGGGAAEKTELYSTRQDRDSDDACTSNQTS